jgi:hypothetical protein
MWVFKPSGWLCERCKKFEVSYFRPSWCDGFNHHIIWVEVIVEGYDFGNYTYCGRVRKGQEVSPPNAEKAE